MDMWGNAVFNPMDPFSSEVDIQDVWPYMQGNYNRGYHRGFNDGSWNTMGAMNMMAGGPYRRPRRRGNHWHGHLHLQAGMGFDPRFMGPYGYGAIGAGMGLGLGGAYGGGYPGGYGGGLAGIGGGYGGGFLLDRPAIPAPQLLVNNPLAIL